MRSYLCRSPLPLLRIGLTFATMLLAAALPAHAQQAARSAAAPMSPASGPSFPTRPITLIMPFPAGGPSDALGRAVGSKMSSALGVPVVVENVGGVGGSVGLQKLARAPADGYTIGFGTIGTHAANMILYRKPMYDAVNDHVPLGLVGSAPLLLLVKKDLPVSDFPQFVAYLKTHKSTMSYGSAGVGSIAHLACLTMLSELDVRSWNGLFAPRGTPPAIVSTLNAAILKALADPDLTRQMSAVGVTFPDPATNTPANLASVVRTEIARLRPVLLARNVHID